MLKLIRSSLIMVWSKWGSLVLNDPFKLLNKEVPMIILLFNLLLFVIWFIELCLCTALFMGRRVLLQMNAHLLFLFVIVRIERFETKSPFVCKLPSIMLKALDWVARANFKLFWTTFMLYLAFLTTSAHCCCWALLSS